MNSRRIPHWQNGFTLIEIMLVLGIIAILVAIVIAAINPTKQLEDARGADRNLSIREIENAISQYIIDGNSLTGVPNFKAVAKDICQDGITGTACTDPPTNGFDLSVLTTNSEYFVGIPVDPSETSVTVTGYRIYQLGSFIKICSTYEDEDCGS